MEGAMANTKSAASKRDGLKDLTPKNPRQVKGGKVQMQDFHFVARATRATP